MSTTRQRSLCWSCENTSADGLRRSLYRTQEANTCGLRRLLPTCSDERDYGRLIFNSDQEPSIQDLKKKVVAELGGSDDVIMEDSPVNEHQSNGVVERAVQTVGGMVRTHKLALEQSKIKEVEADYVVREIPRQVVPETITQFW